MKKGGFMKDALILFAITVVAGGCLGGVYEITKEPIERANQAAQIAAYQEVLPEAVDFNSDGMDERIAASADEIASQGYGNVYIDSAAAAVDASGNNIGYVVSSTSGDGYGGEVKISVGIDEDGAVTGIAFLSLSETPGLGMNATQDSFKGQFAGKNVDKLTVTKSPTGADDEIVAMSGATVTSNAVTNAVNAAIYFAKNCIE